MASHSDFGGFVAPWACNGCFADSGFSSGRAGNGGAGTGNTVPVHIGSVTVIYHNRAAAERGIYSMGANNTVCAYYGKTTVKACVKGMPYMPAVRLPGFPPAWIMVPIPG